VLNIGKKGISFLGIENSFSKEDFSFSDIKKLNFVSNLFHLNKISIFVNYKILFTNKLFKCLILE